MDMARNGNMGIGWVKAPPNRLLDNYHHHDAPVANCKEPFSADEISRTAIPAFAGNQLLQIAFEDWRLWHRPPLRLAAYCRQGRRQSALWSNICLNGEPSCRHAVRQSMPVRLVARIEIFQRAISGNAGAYTLAAGNVTGIKAVAPHEAMG